MALLHTYLSDFLLERVSEVLMKQSFQSVVPDGIHVRQALSDFKKMCFFTKLRSKYFGISFEGRHRSSDPMIRIFDPETCSHRRTIDLKIHLFGKSSNPVQFDPRRQPRNLRSTFRMYWISPYNQQSRRDRRSERGTVRGSARKT